MYICIYKIVYLNIIFLYTFAFLHALFVVVAGRDHLVKYLSADSLMCGGGAKNLPLPLTIPLTLPTPRCVSYAKTTPPGHRLVH